VKHSLPGDPDSGPGAKIFAAVKIAIELGKVGAGDVDPDAMTGEKYICGTPHIDLEFVSLIWLEKFHSFQAFSEACSQDAFGNVHGDTVRINIHQLDHQIGILAICSSLQFGPHWPGSGNRLLEKVKE
jgi:hypothetical protein